MHLLGMCYAISGTDVACGAASPLYAHFGESISGSRYKVRYLPTHLLSAYAFAICLRVWYVIRVLTERDFAVASVL